MTSSSRLLINFKTILFADLGPKPGSFDWKKIVYERIKNGKPASISTVKQTSEPTVDPQQLILDNEARKEAERKADEKIKDDARKETERIQNDKIAKMEK